MTAYSGDAGKTYNARNLRLKRLQADAKIVRIKIRSGQEIRRSKRVLC